MARDDFDPKKFIDRTFETDLFEDLLAFKDDRRILVIWDKRGGMGKSTLLEKFEHRCRTVKPRTPVSLVKLEQLSPQNPLNLVETLATNLGERFSLDFSTFDSCSKAKRLGNLAFFLSSSSVYMQGADLSSASGFKVSAQMFNESIQTVNISNASVQPLTAQQEEMAEKICINAFFEDLKKHCNETPLVILVDTFEEKNCSDRLRKWILTHLMDRYFFDLQTRPKRLLLVIAGRDNPGFESYWAGEDINAVVASREALGKWEKEHVEECLRVNGFLYEASHLELFVNMVDQGMPPSSVVDAMLYFHKALQGNP